MTLAECVDIVTDLVTAGAVVAAVVVAWSGLATWRHELHGRTEYKLAKRVLTCVYEIREVIRSIRSSLVWETDYQDRPGRDPAASSRLSAADTKYVFSQRIDRLQQPMARLRVALTEAEALWGDSLRDADRALSSVLIGLSGNIGEYLTLLSDSEYSGEAHSERRRELERVIGMEYDEEGQESLGADLEAAIEKFNDRVSPFLRR